MAVMYSEAHYLMLRSRLVNNEPDLFYVFQSFHVVRERSEPLDPVIGGLAVANRPLSRV